MLRKPARMHLNCIVYMWWNYTFPVVTHRDLLYLQKKKEQRGNDRTIDLHC
jgi:hypothetical protein